MHTVNEKDTHIERYTYTITTLNKKKVIMELN